MNAENFIQYFTNKYSHETNFLATVSEVSHDVIPYLDSIGAEEQDYALVQRMFEPERIITFKVVWENDQGEKEYNMGHRVQLSSARGPYKGGLRFDASVTVDILKFLALEQTFKNSLTGLPLGSGKGGSDFNPRGKSDGEIKRFCEAFITELYPYIGAEVDVPAGDIGVGGREIGYMLEKYRELSGNNVVGALTGKPVDQHGSYARTEATGYGVIYLTEQVLIGMNEPLEGKSAVVSGAGNVALHAAEKLIDKGVKVYAISEREGYLHCDKGISMENLQLIKQCKAERKSLETLVDDLGYKFKPGKPWREVSADLYFPCATQNELDEGDARAIVENGAILIAEGANMPCTQGAVDVFQTSQTIFVPAKAANAGGVAVSGLEMEQNRLGVQWSFEEVDTKLQNIMKDIYDVCRTYGAGESGEIDYLKGANVGGFVQVFEKMKELENK